MRIGLIDVDNYDKLDNCFPNLALMKLSTWHKQKGDSVEWYNVIDATNQYMIDGSNMYDKVYLSKVFSFTPEYEHFIFADMVERGGTGYCISLVNGKEVFDKDKHKELPYEIEHIMPDYNLYGITDTAYGFMSRGCPRGCGFCHVAPKEGKCAYKVADLSEFWNGQKNIQLYDPNTLACPDWRDILQQLADSKANVEFNQGVDIRLMTPEKAEMLKKIKISQIHFAWDRYEDKEFVVPRLKEFSDTVGYKYCRQKVQCYVLTNFNTTYDQDLERVTTLRELGISPYIMRYDKEHIKRGHYLNSLARWCNMRALFWKYNTFEEYIENNRN